MASDKDCDAGDIDAIAPGFPYRLTSEMHRTLFGVVAALGLVITLIGVSQMLDVGRGGRRPSND